MRQIPQSSTNPFLGLLVSSFEEIPFASNQSHFNWHRLYKIRILVFVLNVQVNSRFILEQFFYFTEVVHSLDDHVSSFR